jgi:hypothetical protein
MGRRTVVSALCALCALLAPSLALASSIDSRQIDEVVHAEQERVQGCYDEGLARNSKLRGKIVVLFTVENDGTVSDVVTKKGTTIKDEKVVDCIDELFETLQFPGLSPGCDASKQDCTVKITYPLTFTP